MTPQFKTLMSRSVEYRTEYDRVFQSTKKEVQREGADSIYTSAKGRAWFEHLREKSYELRCSCGNDPVDVTVLWNGVRRVYVGRCVQCLTWP